jgi:HEAT repeat protein
VKRWILVTLVLGCLAGVTAYFLVPQLFPPTIPDRTFAAKPVSKEAPNVPKEPTTFESEVKQLFDDFHAARTQPPSDATRKLIGKLVAKEGSGKTMVPLLEAWLRAMHEAGRADSSVFRELAQTLLTLDASMPAVVIKEYRQAKFTEADYCAYRLAAFGKVSLPLVLDALREETQDPASFGKESWSKLPWVLAQLGPEAVPSLQTALKSGPAPLQRQALRALALMGPQHAGPALPDVAALLKNENVKVRYLAALALGELNPKTAGPPPDLVETLKDRDPVVRLAGAYALSRHPQFDAAPLVPVLQALLENNAFIASSWDIDKKGHGSASGYRSQPCPYYQIFWEEATADLLIELGPKNQLAAETVVQLLKSCDYEGRHLIHLLLLQGEQAKPAVPALAKMLKHPEAHHRYKALLALGRLPVPLVADQLPEMRALLDDPEPRVRWRAFLNLAQLDAPGTRVRLPVALTPVVDSAGLRSNEPHLAQGRIKTRCVWQNFDTTLQPAWEVPGAPRDPQAVWSLTDEELAIEEERGRAVLIDLESVKTVSKDGIPFLLAAWHGTNEFPRLRVNYTPVTVSLLGTLGVEAAAALPDLMRGLSWYDTRQIANVLVKIGDPAVEALVQVLDNAAATDRHLPALQALQEFGPRAKPASAALVKALRLESEDTRKQAAETIGSLGDAGAEAVPQLQLLLADKDDTVRRHATDALGYLGPVAKNVLPDLIGLFKDDNAQLRLVAVRAAARMGKDAALPLKKALGDANDKIRLGAILALSRLPEEDLPDREAMALALQQLAEDAQQPANVREEAKALAERLRLKKTP